MKRTVIMLFLVATGCGSTTQGGAITADTTLAAAQGARPRGPKKRVGVVDFEDTTGHRLDSAARDVVTEALVKSGAFVVVEREQLTNVLKEQGLGQSGALSGQSIAQAGKLLGLQAIVSGKVIEYSEEAKSGGFGGYYSSQDRIARARVSLRVADANDGSVWVAESAEGSAKESSANVMGAGGGARDGGLGKKALYAAIGQMTSRVLAKVNERPWSGQIAKVGRDGSIYITAGSDVGLPVGAVLKVSHPGEEITDPASGQVIGRERGKTLAQILVAEHMGEKLTVCTVKEGSGIIVGDLVSLAN